MKFAIRDDDLNFFFNPNDIEKNIKNIWDICPISMSAVPFIKGNWIKNTKILEDKGPTNITDEIVQKIKKDNEIFDIANNKELVKYIKQKLKEKKIYLTIHAIHHRNEDKILPKLKKNFSIGAEFYTCTDLTNELLIAIKHLENTFDQKIKIFTPPQNIYNKKGFKAILNNGLNMCSYLPSLKNVLLCINIFGLNNYMKYAKYRLFNLGLTAPYPYLIKSKKIKIMDHKSLQPGTCLIELYKDFEFVYSKGGNFVLSTHSYAFNYKMNGIDKTMGEVLREFLLFVKSKKNVEFVSLDKIMEVEKNESCYIGRWFGD